MKIYVLEKYMNDKHSGGKRVYWPVEAYTSRQKCNDAASRRNANASIYVYRTRPTSLKVIA